MVMSCSHHKKEGYMKKTVKKSFLVLFVLLLVIFSCMIAADKIQTGNGRIEVTEGWIETDIGNLKYKLYTPVTATVTAKAPGVLLLHGYQNDHETCAAYAIELARRGSVVLALDEYGHGATTAGLVNRGYVNHKVTVNYGEDSEEDGTFRAIGGQTRYKVMMNFSNLSFFDEHYTTDSDGNRLTDSSSGGNYAYALLAAMDNVDSSRLVVSGHSMGTWSSWSVAAEFSGTDIAPKAVVLQCGELFRDSAYDSENISFNNVLLLQAKWDEFSYFRDYKRVVDDSLLESDLRTEFLGCTADEAAWDTTYGSFSDGTARRIELLYTNHRLTTHNSHGLATAIDWIDSAVGLETTLPSTNQIAMWKEVLVLIAMLSAVFSTLPLMNILLETPFFKGLRQPLPSKDTMKSSRKWWIGAVITMLIAASTYPFMTQLGHGLLPLPENIFRMTVGNGFLSWYLLLILIMVIMTAVSLKKNRKKGITDRWQSMGLATAENPDRPGWGLFGRSLLLVFCLLLYMYVILLICEKCFLLDFRFIWPFFRTFDLTRLGQFCVYLPIFALFFILNNSKIMASSRCSATYIEGPRGFWGAWWRNALMMVGGILIIVLVEYIPFFLNIGPGADVLFGSTFGGPFMSLLILFAPQVVVFSLLGTYAYRKTGSVYTGALLIASMACWIVTGGSSMM